MPRMKDHLLSLETLRDFAVQVVSTETFMQNLVLEKIESVNERLWILRENMHLDERAFADKLGITVLEYHEYERIGTEIPETILHNVCKEFSVPKDWLCCKLPVLPVPCLPRGNETQ